jgi:putative transcriptional regulator
MIDISRKIKQIRIAKGMSQEQLARELGVALNTVQRWESGKTHPSPLAMERILNKLGDIVKEDQFRLL